MSSEGLTPEQVSSLINEGMQAAEAGRHEEARELFARASQNGDAVALFDLGNTLRELGRMDEAATAFREAMNAGEESAVYNLAQVLEDQGRTDEALDMYVQAGERGDTKGLISASWILEDQGDKVRSSQLLRDAAGRGGSLAAGALGVRLWQDAQNEEAEQYLVHGLDEYPAARVPLAKIYTASGRYSEARAVLTAGVQRNQIDCFLPLGNLLSEIFHSRKEAESCYRLGLSLGDQNCRYNLALLLLSDGRKKEAIRLFTEAASGGDPLAIQYLAKRDKG